MRHTLRSMYALSLGATLLTPSAAWACINGMHEGRREPDLILTLAVVLGISAFLILVYHHVSKPKTDTIAP